MKIHRVLMVVVCCVTAWGAFSRVAQAGQVGVSLHVTNQDGLDEYSNENPDALEDKSLENVLLHAILSFGTPKNVFNGNRDPWFQDQFTISNPFDVPMQVSLLSYLHIYPPALDFQITGSTSIELFDGLGNFDGGAITDTDGAASLGLYPGESEIAYAGVGVVSGGIQQWVPLHMGDAMNASGTQTKTADYLIDAPPLGPNDNWPHLLIYNQFVLSAMDEVRITTRVDALPEPTTLALVCVGGIGLLCRRRRAE